MNTPFQINEEPNQFSVTRPVTAEEILAMAKQLIHKQFERGQSLTQPDHAREFLMLELAMLEHEAFYCIFLDNQHRILETKTCFEGSIASANVYPRELVKQALKLNACAMILAHNHPSGIAEPSECDRAITKRLIDALNLVEVRVLDHFIIAGTEQYSFAEHGLL